MQEGESLSLNYNQFPNLRELIVASSGLKELKLDGRLKLDTLVVNNSQLTTFSYNSTELRNLLLIDNSKMGTFSKSVLPVLKNLTVVRTNLNSWY